MRTLAEEVVIETTTNLGQCNKERGTKTKSSPSTPKPLAHLSSYSCHRRNNNIVIGRMRNDMSSSGGDKEEPPPLVIIEINTLLIH